MSFKIVAEHYFTAEDVELDQWNDPDSLSDLGREGEPFETVDDLLDFLVEQLEAEEIDLDTIEAQGLSLSAPTYEWRRIDE